MRLSSTYTLITFDCFFQRLVGLMGRKVIHPRHVFHFVPCNSVHTFGMTVPLTVIFLDKQSRVLHFIDYLAPARVAWYWPARSVLELRAGSITSNRQARELVALLLPMNVA
ncbi:MAG: DUF192 domain-containing protein [Advenella sp.]|uniref:DUF192 domain-containing protein n=1 Tax=Advenella kashmirensis TaxID=310575 RepID=A0A356LBT5_9BURK|nr:DUF192 domain-containing protein [Advenella sp. FME57]HBP28437.1 DUF192 domain-containing protein [Advenella kashmirensis]